MSRIQPHTPRAAAIRSAQRSRIQPCHSSCEALGPRGNACTREHRGRHITSFSHRVICKVLWLFFFPRGVACKLPWICWMPLAEPWQPIGAPSSSRAGSHSSRCCWLSPWMPSAVREAPRGGGEQPSAAQPENPQQCLKHKPTPRTESAPESPPCSPTLAHRHLRGRHSPLVLSSPAASCFPQQQEQSRAAGCKVQLWKPSEERWNPPTRVAGSVLEAVSASTELLRGGETHRISPAPVRESQPTEWMWDFP